MTLLLKQLLYISIADLTTSFTGEDSLDVAIDSGTVAATPDNPMAFDSGNALSVTGVSYSFPLGTSLAVVGADDIPVHSQELVHTMLSLIT